MSNVSNTKNTAQAIARVCPRFSDPVVLPEMGRQNFEDFLHELFGRPDGQDWKRPIKANNLEEDQDFYRVEHFDTPIGPLMATHIKENPDQIIFVVNKPLNHNYTTLCDFLDYAKTVVNKGNA